MDDPQAIAGRIGDIAKEAVNTSAGIAFTAFRKINQVPDDDGNIPPRYTPADAVTSMNDLIAAMLKAGVDMARVPLRVNYDQNMMTLADNVASIVGRGITQAAQIAGKAAASVEKDGVKNQTALDSAIELTNIAMLRTAEIAEAVAAGPGLYRDPVLYSDPITVADDGTVRQLKLLSMARQDTGEDITAQVWFDPANGVLMPGMTQFRLVANSAGLPSGVYCGVVEVKTTGPAPARPQIAVEFAL